MPKNALATLRKKAGTPLGVSSSSHARKSVLSNNTSAINGRSSVKAGLKVPSTLKSLKDASSKSQAKLPTTERRVPFPGKTKTAPMAMQSIAELKEPSLTYVEESTDEIADEAQPDRHERSLRPAAPPSILRLDIKVAENETR